MNRPLPVFVVAWVAALGLFLTASIVWGESPTDPLFQLNAATGRETTFATPLVSHTPSGKTPRVAPHPIDQAFTVLARCRERLESVFDYETRLVIERREGRDRLAVEDIRVKFRRRNRSMYARWYAPSAGRELIFVQGMNGGQALVHDAVQRSDRPGRVSRISDRPTIQSMAPTLVRQADVADLIDGLETRWNYERLFQETEVEIASVRVNGRPCIMIVTIHPKPDDGKFSEHTCRVYVDREHLLPIRVERLDYPATAGREPGAMVETTTFLRLKINPGLRDDDFSIANPQYEFSRYE